MTIQVGIPPFAPGLSVHDHTTVAQGGKLNKYNDVFNNPDLIMSVLSDHNKTVHNALGIDADTVDGIDFPSAIAAVLTDHNKANHDPLGLDHEELSNIIANAHHAQLHAAEHKVAGGDSIKIDELAVPDDNTLLNVLTTKHGLCPKLPDDASKFLDGLGSWVVPGGAGLQVKVISSTRDLSAAPGNVNYVGAGFQPKGAIFIGAMIGSAVHIMGVGFTDGTTDRMIFNAGYDATLSEDGATVLQAQIAAGNQCWAVVSAFIADGVTLTWSKAGTPTGTLEFGIIFLG